MGINASSSWGQEILPKIRARYDGKIIWKGALNQDSLDYSNIDFVGYDYIGLSIIVPSTNDTDSFRSKVTRLIDSTLYLASRAGVMGVMITELGHDIVKNDGNVNDERYALNYNIVFEEGNGKVAGFFITDMPAFLGPPLRDSLKEATIKEWFKERLP